MTESERIAEQFKRQLSSCFPLPAIDIERQESIFSRVQEHTLCELPEDFRVFYSIVDGSGGLPILSIDSAISAPSPAKFSLLSLVDILAVVLSSAATPRPTEVDDWNPFPWNNRFDLRKEYHRGWITIGWRDVFLDLAPGSMGTIGQVAVYYPSMAVEPVTDSFFELVAASLEKPWDGLTINPFSYPDPSTFYYAARFAADEFERSLFEQRLAELLQLDGYPPVSPFGVIE